MAQLPILTPKSRNSAVLHEPTTRVRDFGPSLHKLLNDMIETLRAAPGVGLAAPQIGINQRIAIVEYPDDEERPEETMRLYELINPEIIKSKGNEVGQEGCLSLPGLAADVNRATFVLVRAYDRRGKEFRIKAYDWLARIFQHEIDHLQGVLMTDRAEQIYKVVEKDKDEYELVPIEDMMAALA